MRIVRGFTLVEVAIVLVVVGLLLAGLLVPLGVQRDVRDYAATRADLSEYKEALVGYALSQTPPYLPCPDTVGGGRNRRGTCCWCLPNQYGRSAMGNIRIA